MATINYEIPEDLHRALKMKAAQHGVTLKEVILVYLAWTIESPGPEPLLASLGKKPDA
jgi:plasmid stability protein